MSEANPYVGMLRDPYHHLTDAERLDIANLIVQQSWEIRRLNREVIRISALTTVSQASPPIRHVRADDPVSDVAWVNSIVDVLNELHAVVVPAAIETEEET